MKVFVIQNEEKKIIGAIANQADAIVMEKIVQAIEEHYNAIAEVRSNDFHIEQLRESYAYDGIKVTFLIDDEDQPAYKEIFIITATEMY